MTTAFNGGFASVRSLPWAGWAALGRGGGVRMLVRGDGRTYKLNLKVGVGPRAWRRPRRGGGGAARVRGSGARCRAPGHLACSHKRREGNAPGTCRGAQRDSVWHATPRSQTALQTQTDDSWDGVAWQADFTAGSSGSGADGWQVVDLPFSAFYPSLRGRVVSGQPPLDGGRVRQLGFMLSKFGSAGGVLPDFREGGFSLAVRGVSGLAAPR